MKRLLITFAVLLGLATLPSMAQTPIGLGVGYDDPTIFNGDYPRMPTRPMYIYQDGYSLTLPALDYDFTLCLLDADDEVVYSVFVPAGTTLVTLPGTLSGNFEIRLVTDTFYYYGFITL